MWLWGAWRNGRAFSVHANWLVMEEACSRFPTFAWFWDILDWSSGPLGSGGLNDVSSPGILGWGREEPCKEDNLLAQDRPFLMEASSKHHLLCPSSMPKSH